jgi:hypothetical protein
MALRLGILSDISKDLAKLSAGWYNSAQTPKHALKCLQNPGDDKVGQFLASIMRFQFIIALVVAKYILHSTVYLSNIISVLTLKSYRTQHT